MDRKNIRLYFLRWYFPYNIGDTVMLSSVFRAIKEVYTPCTLEVVADITVAETFQGDPYVDTFRLPRWREKKLPKSFYAKGRAKTFLRGRGSSTVVIWPEWKAETFAYMAEDNHLEECIDSPYKNIISYNYALQISSEVAAFHDLRPRIYLTDDEIEEAKKIINPNSIAINMARIRNSQSRMDGEMLRYKKESWKDFVQEIKLFDPTITIYEIGQEHDEGVGDVFLPNTTIRRTAAILKTIRLVVLSDGGVHNICNAMGKKVLLFQGYEWNPPDLFKMGNAIFNPEYHMECRKSCHLFTDILKIKSLKETCSRECYALDPHRLAEDCIKYLRENPTEDHV